MKCISGIFLCAATLFGQAASFTNGQAARLVIGQPTFTAQDANSSDATVGGVSGIAYANDTLIVADSNRVGAFPLNHRVLVYQGLSSMIPSPTDELVYSRKCPVCVGRATVVLGQPDFTTATENLAATANALRLPTAVATDGVHVVVADTNHNRVLIWNRIPTINNQAADVVVGQADMKSSGLPGGNTPNAKSMRGPQGVWIQNGRLYVADTQNNRILIFNRIPTANGAAADVVLGAPDFTTFVEPDLTQQKNSAAATNLLNPVSVTSDGIRLVVTDLGYNRVLIWNTIPTSNAAAADIVIGQPDMNSSVPNYAYKVDPADTTGKQTPVLCTTATGNDTNSNPTYPAVCNATLNFPRFALIGSGRLFIADGGNDRVLVFNKIPTQNAPSADTIIGQLGGTVNQASDAADSLRTPMSLAWDGASLYVSDAFNRRITVYSLAPAVLPYQAVRNSASLEIIASGSVTIGGTVKAGDIVTITIGNANTATPVNYPYTVQAADTLTDIVQNLVKTIRAANGNTGDPNVFVSADTQDNKVILTAREPGDLGNQVTYSVTTSTGSQVTASAAGSTLTGGGDAAKIAPGTIVTIFAAEGSPIADQNAAADLTQNSLPTRLGGTSVYFNGIPAPLFMVSPTQVTAQVPWEVNDTTSINAYVRSILVDGRILTSTPVAITIVGANPGVFSVPGTPSVGAVYHGSSQAIGIVDVQGSVTAGDVVTVNIEDRAYTYTVVSGDTLFSIRDNLAALINQDSKVSAEPSGVFSRIVLKARVEGPDGNNIPYTATASGGATEVITAFTPQLCCANVEGAPVTPDNPAVPGEFIYVFATGLGLPVLEDTIAPLVTTGVKYPVGGPNTQPTSENFVSSIVGGSTADVITATLQPGSVGTFKVVLHLNSGLASNPSTALTIAQGLFVSRVVTLPVQSAAPPQ